MLTSKKLQAIPHTATPARSIKLDNDDDFIESISDTLPPVRSSTMSSVVSSDSGCLLSRASSKATAHNDSEE